MMALTFLFVIDCHRPLVTPHLSRADTFWQWGGAAGRDGVAFSALQPPFRLLWTYRGTGGFDQAITASGHTLFAGSKDGYLHLINVQNGKRLGKILVHNKKPVTVCTDGQRFYLFSRWAKTSIQAYTMSPYKRVWKKKIGAVIGEPVLKGDRLYVINRQGEMYCFESASGRILWQKNLNGSCASSPCLGAGFLFVAMESGEVRAYDQQTGASIWSVTLDGGILASPICSKNTLFIGTLAGRFYAIHSTSGEIKWDFDCHGDVYEKAAADDSLAFLGTARGQVYALNRDTGRLKWEQALGGVVGTSPVIANNWIGLGILDKRFFTLNRQTGAVMWQFETLGRVRTCPLIWKDILIFGSEDRYLYGFTP